MNESTYLIGPIRLFLYFNSSAWWYQQSKVCLYLLNFLLFTQQVLLVQGPKDEFTGFFFRQPMSTLSSTMSIMLPKIIEWMRRTRFKNLLPSKSTIKFLHLNFLKATLSILMRQTSILKCFYQGFWRSVVAKGPLRFEQQIIQIISQCWQV